MTAPPCLASRCSGQEGWSWPRSAGKLSAQSRTAPLLHRHSDVLLFLGHPGLRKRRGEGNGKGSEGRGGSEGVSGRRGGGSKEGQSVEREEEEEQKKRKKTG